jgi:23S rRNA pseudouridine1911/1915/1917 synthase
LSTPSIDCPPERFHWLVPSDLAGTIRADSLLNQNLPILSRRAREELFSRQAVRINGRPVAKGFRVSPGDRLEIEIPGPLNPYPVPDQAPQPSVMLEDQALVIVDKPGLMPTHPLSPFETGTMANILVSHWPQIVQIGNKPMEPGLIHRLDTGTSGLLVVALTQTVWVQLKKDLVARKWKKTYQALIAGVISKPMTISIPLAHHPGDARKMKGIHSPGDKRRGRIYPAITHIQPLINFSEYTLVEIHLITGVTHQIRAHLSIQGHPVGGDTLYGSKSGQELGLPLNRFFLHAYHLSLPHPITREQITCCSELPEDLQRVLSRLK